VAVAADAVVAEVVAADAVVVVAGAVVAAVVVCGGLVPATSRAPAFGILPAGKQKITFIYGKRAGSYRPVFYGRERFGFWSAASSAAKHL
jgi:hypothetical protein